MTDSRPQRAERGAWASEYMWRRNKKRWLGQRPDVREDGVSLLGPQVANQSCTRCAEKNFLMEGSPSLSLGRSEGL